MWDSIRIFAPTDPYLAGLYERAEEYAAIYRMTRERQKGCDGLGELNNLKDEIKCTLEDMFEYCRNRGLLKNDEPIDAEAMLAELSGLLENKL